MQTTVKPLPGSQAEITITLEPAEVSTYFDKVYQHLSQGRIRGFRPGKAPRSIIRGYFDDEQIRASAYMEIVEDVLPKAMEEVGESRIIGDPGLPSFDEITIAEGEGFTFVVTVSLYPEAEIADLGEVKLLRSTADVTDEDVDRVIDRMREQKATWAEVSRAIGPGDRVTADVVVNIDGEEKLRQEDFVIEALEPKDEEAKTIPTSVLGHLVGQTVTVEEPFGEDHADEEMRGKTAKYEVTIKKIDEKQLPEVSDDFAGDMGEYSNVDEMKADIRRQLEEHAVEHAQEALESQAVGYILANTDVEVPEVLAAQATAARINELEQELEGIGASLDELINAGSLDIERVETAERQRAIIGLETRLAIEALLKKQELEAEEQDIEAEIAALAESTKNEVSFVKQAYELQEEVQQQVDSRAKVRRALRFVIENGEVEEVAAADFDERHRELLRELEEKRRARRMEKSSAFAEEEGEAEGEGEGAVEEGAVEGESEEGVEEEGVKEEEKGEVEEAAKEEEVGGEVAEEAKEEGEAEAEAEAKPEE